MKDLNQMMKRLANKEENPDRWIRYNAKIGGRILNLRFNRYNKKDMKALSWYKQKDLEETKRIQEEKTNG